MSRTLGVSTLGESKLAMSLGRTGTSLTTSGSAGRGLVHAAVKANAKTQIASMLQLCIANGYHNHWREDSEAPDHSRSPKQDRLHAHSIFAGVRARCVQRLREQLLGHTSGGRSLWGTGVARCDPSGEVFPRFSVPRRRWHVLCVGSWFSRFKTSAVAGRDWLLFFTFRRNRVL